MERSFYTYLVKAEVMQNGKTYEVVRRIRLPHQCAGVHEMPDIYDWICGFDGKINIKECVLLKDKERIHHEENFTFDDYAICGAFA